MDIKSLLHPKSAGREIGSHSLTHTRLTECGPDKLKDEIYGSKLKLEKLINISAKSFCYPYGEWNGTVRKNISDAGYSSACAVSPGTVSVTGVIFTLKRIRLNTSDELNGFRRKVSPWHPAYRSLKRI
jgi:peptidoglycan/xylan/chitin deacetylase (PgdA/CDA1 family)